MPTPPPPHLEHVGVELLLQALVGEVDAQLLERVVLKALKAWPGTRGWGRAGGGGGGGGQGGWARERAAKEQGVQT